MISRQRQRAVCGQLVHRLQQSANLVRMGHGHQRKVDGVERQVAAEREQAQPGVAVDVALADLDEPPAEGEQLQPRALRGAGERS